MESPERPEIDYANLPHLPREGIQSKGNFKYATRSLFLETADKEDKPNARWCLSEHEIFAYGKWFPSAWMAYIYATDEYDALRKICGNVKQWERIKEMRQPKDFSVILEHWRTEQAYLQRGRMREALFRNAVSGLPGCTAAARIVLGMIDGPLPKGRPAKKKETTAEVDNEQVAGDHSRVAHLLGK